MAIEEKIANSHLLTDLYGRWPSFHDAEVLEITMRREMLGPRTRPCLNAAIHLCRQTSLVDEGSSSTLIDPQVVRLSFLEIDQLTMTGFNHQNVLSNLFITEISEKQFVQMNFRVHFAGIFGVDLCFECNSIQVHSIQPWQECTA